MGKYVYYDEKEGVMLGDFSGLTLTPEILRASIDEIIALSKTLPGKVYILTNWKDTRLPIELTEYFAEVAKEVYPYIKGALRYDANISVTNIAIRTAVIKHRIQKAKSGIYASKEEALAAVHRLQLEEKLRDKTN